MTRKLKNELTREDLDRLPVHPGLCATCVHLRLLRSRRSVFLRCGKAETDDRFLRYPPLPVGRCGGWEDAGA